MHQPSQLSKESAILQLIKQVLQFENLLESGFVQSLNQSISMQTQRNVGDLSSEVDTLRQISASLQQQIDSMSQMIEIVTGYYDQTESRFDLTNGKLLGATISVGNAQDNTEYLQKIRQGIFANEHRLRVAIPNSFYIHTQQNNDISSFIGVYEKAGLTYVSFVDVKTPHARVALAMAVNSILDKAILGSRLADSNEILQTIDSLLASFVDKQGELEVGLLVLERLSMAMTYHCTKLSLFQGLRGVVQEAKAISNQTPMTGFNMNTDRTYLDKGNMFRGENASYYLANEAVFNLLGNGQRETGIESFKQLLNSIQNVSLADQKNAIEQQIRQQATAKNYTQELQVLGFQF